MNKTSNKEIIEKDFKYLIFSFDIPYYCKLGVLARIYKNQGKKSLNRSCLRIRLIEKEKYFAKIPEKTTVQKDIIEQILNEL